MRYEVHSKKMNIEINHDWKRRIHQAKKIFPLVFALLVAVATATNVSYAATGSNADTEGEAYVSGLTVRSQTDGIGPFDDDDQAGDDSSDSNLIVRSFDDVGYTLEYTTALMDVTHPVSGNVTLNAEFLLPVSPDKARFDEQSLNWMTDRHVSYLYSDGMKSDTWNKSKTVTGQVLTGSRILRNSSDNDKVPGAGQLSVGVSVKAAANGDKIIPSFKLTASGTTTSKTTQPKPVTVSAKARYNLEMKNNSHTPDNIVYANSKDGTTSMTETEGSTRGRIYGRSVALALWNTSAEKGLKGIELPQGDITYDLKTIAILDNEDSTDNGDWGVSLWDYKENTMSDKGKNGRNMLLFDDSRTSYEAYGSVLNSLNDGEDSRDSAYNGGNITVKQDANDPTTLHVTVSKYAFDLDSFTFPKKYAPYDDGEPDIAGNIGYFSAGYFQYLARFPEHVDDISNFYVETKASNFYVKTLSGAECTTEEKTDDNRIGNTVVVYAKGEFSKLTSYLHNNSYYNSGDDWNRPSAEQKCTSRLDYSGSNPIRAIDFLLKFDTNVFTIMPDSAFVNPLHPSTAINMEKNTKILYAVKKDGSGWTSDDEMQTTRQEQLLYYDDADKLEASGKKCVGVLYQARDVYLYAGSDNPEFICSYKIADDAPSGYVAQSISDARAWTVPQPGIATGTKNADGTIGTMMSSEYGNTKWVDGYTEPEYTDYTPYSKTVYKDGSIAGGHINGIRGGDSLLIVPAENRVDITVADKTSSGEAKSVYDLDADERTAMFNVKPSIVWKSNGYIDDAKDGTADVYVTIPKGLTYDDGSCTRTAKSIIKNDDGTTTLLIPYSDISFGDKLDEFQISCTIGEAGTAHDVENNAQLNVQARITSSFDSRNATKERGNLSDTTIAVIRLAAISILKSVSPQHGNVGCNHVWTMKFGNSSKTTVNDMIVADVMPYNGDRRNTSFTGKYNIKKITIDFSDMDGIDLPDEPLSYSSDRDITADDIDEIVKAKAALQFKSIGKPQIAGNTLTFDNINLTNEQLKALKLNIDTLSGSKYATMKIYISVADDKGTLYQDENGKTQKSGDIYGNSFAEYANGQASIVYSNVVEHNVKSKTITVNKKWVTNGYDDEEYRPNAIDITIIGSDGSKHHDDIYSEHNDRMNNEWSRTFELPYYDANGKEITYTVSEASESKYYKSSVSGNQDDGFTITNTFTFRATGTIAIKGTKKISGRMFENGDSITFHIDGEIGDGIPQSMPSDNDDNTKVKAPLPNNVNDAGDITINPTTGTSSDIDFGTITVDLRYLHKTLIYTVTEKSASGRGLGIDTAKRTIVIYVRGSLDNGTINIEILDDQSDDLTFNDKYTPEATPISFTIKKQLAGRQWKTTDSFNATVTAKSSDTITKQEVEEALGGETKTIKITAPATGDTSSVDTPISVKKAGTYVYTVSEKNAGKRIEGVSYDPKTITVTITVTQDTNTGKLIATSSYSDGTKTTDTFENTYTADGGSIGGIKVIKKLIGRKWKDTDQFPFHISASDNDTKNAVTAGNVILPANDTITVNNDNEHTASFGDITIKAAGTYKFDIEEQQHGILGVDTAPKATVTINATDNGSGKIECSFDGESSLTFTDYYGKNSKTTLPIVGEKILSHDGYSKTPDITGKYTFTLKDENGTTIDTSKNDKEGKIDLGMLTYTMDDLDGVETNSTGQRVKTFRYTVSESGNVNGIENDTQSTKDIIVTVTDNGNGNITAATNTTGGNAFTFTNTFSASCKIPAIGGTKTVKNASDNDTSLYSFMLKATDDTTSKAIDDGTITSDSGNSRYQIASCKADGKFAFAPMTVKKPGTYSFNVSEIVPADGKKEAGITYDKTIYTLTYVVSMNDDGTMSVKADEKNTKSCDFINVYDATGTAEIKASKILDGEELKADEFEFELLDNDDNVISTAKNDANGDIAFDKIEYGIKDAGKTYSYKIREKTGNEVGITYDDKVITVNVDVKNAGDGKLTANILYGGKNNISVFHNKYEEPKTITKIINKMISDTFGGTGSNTIGNTIGELVQTGVDLIPYLTSIAICAMSISVAMRRKIRKK